MRTTKTRPRVTLAVLAAATIIGAIFDTKFPGLITIILKPGGAVFSELPAE